jgi:nicotinamide mononucleotide adenylyltransferase
MIARWQPVHRGHAAVLRALCARHGDVRIGIGSADVNDARSPFRLDEVRAMLGLVLADFDNYSLIPLPDLHDGPRWRAMVLEDFGQLDVFYTANPYVRELLQEDYRVEHPVTLLTPDEQVPLDGTAVRLAMARGEPYAHLLPPAVAVYLEDNRLVERFRSEFGLETLALETIIRAKE